VIVQYDKQVAVVGLELVILADQLGRRDNPLAVRANNEFDLDFVAHGDSSGFK